LQNTNSKRNLAVYSEILSDEFIFNFFHDADTELTYTSFIHHIGALIVLSRLITKALEIKSQLGMFPDELTTTFKDVMSGYEFLFETKSKYPKSAFQVSSLLRETFLARFLSTVSTGFCVKSSNRSQGTTYKVTPSFLNFCNKVEQNKEITIIDFNTIKKYKVPFVTSTSFTCVYDGNEWQANSVNEISRDIYRDIKKSKCGVSYKEVHSYVCENYKRVVTVTPLLEVATISVRKEDSDLYQEPKALSFVDETEKPFDVVTSHVAKVDLNEIYQLMDSCLITPQERKCLRDIIKQSDTDGRIVFKYRRTAHGRMYMRGYSIQMLPSWIRKRVLSSYKEVDISSAIYSIVYNHAKKEGIQDSDIPLIKKIAENPHEFREKLHTQYVEYDSSLTIDYVKTFLIAVAYGANVDHKYVAFDYIKDKKSIPFTIEGYSNSEVPLFICQDDRIIQLRNEIVYVTKTLCNKRKFKKESCTYLPNEFGQNIQLTRGTSIGRKLAHIYQAVENQILIELMNITNNNGSSAKDFIGLLLHDGIWIEKSFLENITEEDFSKHIFNTLGYNLKFSIS
jgi:hypothetical protein